MNGKPSLARAGTMAVTAKIGMDIIGDEQLGDTRAVTHTIQSTKKLKMSKARTMKKTMEEAKVILGGKGVDMDKPRSLRKRSPAKPKSASTASGDTKSKKSKKRPNQKKSSGRVEKKTSAKKKKSVSIKKSSGTSKKPSMKRAGTMVRTAQEGKKLLKRGVLSK